MKAKLYSYRDQLIGFGPVVVENSEQTAVRGFSYAVNSASGMMGFSPKDYDLCYIGEFDTDKGVVTPSPVPVVIVNGTSVYGDKE